MYGQPPDQPPRAPQQHKWPYQPQPPRRLLPLTVTAAIVAVFTAFTVAAFVYVSDRYRLEPIQRPAPAAESPTSTAVTYTDAKQITTILATTAFIAGCTADSSVGATSQQRCVAMPRGEVIAMVFADSTGVQARINFFGTLGRSAALVRGPNWLVNVGDLDPGSQETVRHALSGTMIRLAGS